MACRGRRRATTALQAFATLDADTRATRLPAYWVFARCAADLAEALAIATEGRTIAERTGRTAIALLIAVEEIALLRRYGRLADGSSWASRRSSGRGKPGSRRRCGGRSASCRRRGWRPATSTAPCATHTRPGRASRTSASTARGGRSRSAQRSLEGAPEALDAELEPDIVELEVAAGDLEAAARHTGTLARAQLLLATEDSGSVAVAAQAVVEADGPRAHARARLVEGRALARFGDRSQAIAALTEAHAALEGRDRDLATRELRRLGHRVRRAASTREGSLLDGLTEREEEIAQLVAAGLSNREVAERLVLRHEDDRDAPAQHLRQARRRLAGRAGAAR